MKNRLMIYRSVIILSIFIHGFTIPAYGESGCEQANWGSPLEYTISDNDVNSPFNPNPPKDHYGVDYRAADGDNVLAVADGKILRVDFGPFKELGKPDARTGLKKRSWGQYVVVKHLDGSTTLYAHLVEKSTDHLHVGMSVVKGQIIGKADSTGGVTGPHLHLEYSPTGEWNKRLKKKDPHPCLVSCPTGVPLAVSGPETITRNSSAQYTANGCPSNVEWSVSGKGATISSTGLLTAGSTACGSLTVTASCSGCGTSATQYVRVTDAGVWVLFLYAVQCAFESSINAYDTCISGDTKNVYGLLMDNGANCIDCSQSPVAFNTNYSCPLYAACSPQKPGCSQDTISRCYFLSNTKTYKWVCP